MKYRSIGAACFAVALAATSPALAFGGGGFHGGMGGGGFHGGGVGFGGGLGGGGGFGGVTLPVEDFAEAARTSA